MDYSRTSGDRNHRVMTTFSKEISCEVLFYGKVIAKNTAHITINHFTTTVLGDKIVELESGRDPQHT